MTQVVRLYITDTLSPGALIALDEQRAHYVRHVMRLEDDEKITAFNAENGEWEASLQSQGKRSVQLVIGTQVSTPRPCPDVWLAFAAIKNKNELVVEKATELGVREIHPIFTRHAVVKSVNIEKLQAHATLAAEQCERHDVPAITTHKNLANFLGSHPAGRLLLYGDETGASAPLFTVIPAPERGSSITRDTPASGPRPPIKSGVTILIGPEGGFSAEEHRMLQSSTFAIGFGMGPRILRADTAAVAALACVLSAAGDWSQPPHFKRPS
ncbi:MAG: 16S rRNA (uracil(1498)-N(3))-methyltransferase [Alphaproteobacteria bacterium]|nr:16S rRNA (uracil(1498)-N(3))-methyltransferase [Alphaproteobacteria bacterium]